MKKIILSLALILLSGCSIVSEQSLTTPAEPMIQKKEVVHITKFFDFQCSYCAAANDTMKQIQDRFGNKVQISYKHFPVKSGSKKLAEASECAGAQKKFGMFKDEYFNSHFGKSDNKTLQTIAEKINLDIPLFTTCVESGVERSTIDIHIKDGKKISVKAVPFFVIEDQKLKGAYPYRVFESIIKAYLQEDTNE